jgi:multicomponent Na+:H+ antiporter subunit C
MTLVLAIPTALLFACGTFMLLQRQLSRIVIGVGLLGHGANLMLLQSAGDTGEPAFVGSGTGGSFTDPLPQALMLTAIVITFGLTVFLLALAFRSWIVSHDDEVEDDIEDRLISRQERRIDAADAAEAADAADAAEGAREIATAGTAPTLVDGETTTEPTVEVTQ